MSKAICLRCFQIATMAFVMVCISLLSVSASHAGLIAYYNFNDSSDAAAAPDSSGNGNHGVVEVATYGGAGSGVTGAAGDQAMDFGAFNNGAYVDIPSAASGAFQPLVDSQDVTISMWQFGGPDQPVSQWTLYFGAESDPGIRQLGSHAPWGNGQIYWDVSDCCDPDERINAPATPDQFSGKWNHYAFVKNQDYSAIYINGSLFLDSGGNSINDIVPIGVARIGSGPNGESSYSGLIDDFAVFDEALSAETIAGIANGSIAVPEPSSIFLATFGVLGLLGFLWKRRSL